MYRLPRNKCALKTLTLIIAACCSYFVNLNIGESSKHYTWQQLQIWVNHRKGMDARERERVGDCVEELLLLFYGREHHLFSKVMCLSRASVPRGALALRRKLCFSLNEMVAVLRWLRSSEGQRATGFWMSGLLNNSNFVIMNAGAKSIAAGG